MVVVDKEQSLPANVTQVVVPDTLRVAGIYGTARMIIRVIKFTVTFGVTGTNGKTSIATMIHLIQRKLQKNQLIFRN